MARIAPKSGTGISRETGQVLDGWPHVLQSLGVIFSTHLGERVMRRWFGSNVPKLLGQNMVPETVVRFWSAICIAVDLWEPRFRVVSITPVGSAQDLRQGQIGFNVTGEYRPNALLGDFTPAGVRTVIA